MRRIAPLPSDNGDSRPLPTVAAALVVTWLTALIPSACTGPGAGPPAIDSITTADLRADLAFLASDEMRGRLAGTPEVAIAARWIASRFDRAGLEPAGPGGSFLQPFDLMYFRLEQGQGAGPRNTLTVAAAGTPASRRAPGDGWYPLSFSASAQAAGEVVFAGYGIVEPRFDHDDYGDADVSGKVVLVMQHEPDEDDPESVFDGVVTAESSRDWRKALSAQERGAAAILFVTDAHRHDPVTDWERAAAQTWSESRRVERFTLAEWMERIEIPAARISAELAEALVSGAGRSFVELAAAAETAGGSQPLPLPDARVELSVAVERHRAPAANVVAKVEGADPALRDEVVIICAHHDHDGATDEGVFNGADDDGSGTVALLELADALALAAEQGRRPRRTILLAAWDAEERGLLGAWYYTVRPLMPLEATVATLNMDMIGRHQEVPADGGGRFRGLEPQTAESNSNATNILGYTHSADLQAAVERANEPVGLELKFRYDNNASQLLRRSDHWPFLQNRVPALWFHTGLHPDYHRFTDDPVLIEYDKMERIVRLVYRLAWQLADADGRPGFDR